MSSHKLLLKAMRDVLRESGISEVTAAGEFCLPAASPVLFPGAVYGFAVKLTGAELIALFDEVASRKLNRVKRIDELRPIEEGLYPIYWGKDKQLGARPYQHLQDPSGTGALRLSTYRALEGKSIGCVSLSVTDFKAAELALQKRYPHLLKTTTVKYAV